MLWHVTLLKQPTTHCQISTFDSVCQSSKQTLFVVQFVYKHLAIDFFRYQRHTRALYSGNKTNYNLHVSCWLVLWVQAKMSLNYLFCLTDKYQNAHNANYLSRSHPPRFTAHCIKKRRLIRVNSDRERANEMTRVGQPTLVSTVTNLLMIRH